MAAVALSASGCGTSSKTGIGSTSPTSAPNGAYVTTGTAPPKPVHAAPAEALTAITRYESKHGPKLGTFTINAVEGSTVDETYALYKVVPLTGHEGEFEAGYGFAHQSGGKWAVVGFGTSDVGCPPGGAGNAVVPEAVLTGFGLECAAKSG